MKLLLFMIALNLFGFIIMGYDKGLAKHNGWRISEKTFFIIAIFGGGMGVYFGMRVFHHKTKHRTFVYGIPFLVTLNLVAIITILYQFRGIFF